MVLNVFASSKGHCMRGSMAEFPADADSVFEATLNALSTSAGNLPCCLSCTVRCYQQTCWVKLQQMEKALSLFPEVSWHFCKIDCLNLLAMFCSINAGSIFMIDHSTTFTS